MVADAWHLVVGDGDRARIEKLSIDEPADHDTVAISDGLLDRLAQALREAGHAGQDIVLGLPSQWCYSASVSTDGLPRRDRRQALGYRLEEKLPVALEELTVDFVDTDQPTVLGVAVSTARLAPLIRGLEARDIPVQAALPTALLAPPEPPPPEPPEAPEVPQGTKIRAVTSARQRRPWRGRLRTRARRHTMSF